jgi:hypothetical protein
MFEQELYEKEAAEMKTEPGDLFHNYEIRGLPLNSPRFYKIFAVAGFLNIFAFLMLGQPQLFTRGACESPFVGRVCTVLDTVYVGSLIFGTERDYVDKEYEKTEIDDADIVWIDQTGVGPQFAYPEGYFYQDPALAAASEVGTDSGFLAPGIPSNPRPITSTPLINTPQVLKPANPNAVTGKEGDLFTTEDDTAAGENPTVANAVDRKGKRGGRVNGGANANKADTATNATPGPTPLSSDAVTAVEINKKPLTDFVDQIVSQWATGQVDVAQEFTVVLNGVLTPEGRLDPVKSKFDATKEKGDKKMIEVAKSALTAVGDSGFLTYLRSLDVEKFTVTLVQDADNITAVISSPQKSEERARKISSGMSGYIMIGKTTAKNPSDELALLEGAKVTSEGKNFIINFTMPKPIAQEMINRKLKEAQAKQAAQPQPNGTATTTGNDNTALR